jgi:hypothetical protein
MREAKMEKILILTLVLSVVVGLTATAAEACPQNDNAVSNDIVLTASTVTVFEIQDESGSAYIVYLEAASQPSDEKVDGTAHTAVAELLPEPITLAMLGLCGFMLSRRKTTHC